MEAIISPNSRIRYQEHFKIGEYSILDDYCYLSTKITIGRFSHIASGCSIAGGEDMQFVLGDYCSLSSGVKIWCKSNDFVNDLVVITPADFKIDDNLIKGDVIIEDMCGIGSNTVIMPDNRIPEGVSIGALSFVPANFKFQPWMVYAGVPIVAQRARNKKNVLEQVLQIEAQINSSN